MSTFINQQKSWRKVLGWLSSTSIIGIFSSRVTRSFSSSVNSKEARYTPLRIEKKETKLHKAFITSSFQSLSLKAQSHFQLRVESHPGLHWFIGFASLRSVIGPSSQQIRCKTKTNHDLVARFFPHFKQFGCFISSSRLPLKIFCDLTLVLVLRQSIGKSVLLLSNKVYPEKVRMSETINVLKPLCQSVMIRVTWCILRQKAYIMKVSQNKSVNFSEMPWQRFK